MILSKYIRFIPKDILMLELWKAARKSPYHHYIDIKETQLTLEEIRNDINYMILNNRDLCVTTYYGKMLFIDVSKDYVDTNLYNLYNGKNKAELIIRNLKLKELEKTLIKYYTFF